MTTPLSLTCVSSGGPASSVNWTRNGVALTTGGADFTTSQTLVDTEQATYHNTLTASGQELLQGNFTCTVGNLADSATETIESE